MKKIILLALTSLMMVGCEENNERKYKYYKSESSNTVCVIIDHCEYIVNYEIYAFAYTSNHYVTYTHKGNCRFCKERRKRELRELIKELKEK